MRTGHRALIALATLLTVVALAFPAAAHKEVKAGKLRLVVGWLEEPAFAGLPNAVEVGVRRGGQPVRDARLDVVVVFGGRNASVRTDPMPLEPAFDAPGEYRATVIPTRPGTYTFEISGGAGGSTVEETITSGPQTFDDVQTSSEVQFPERDPTQGEIAERLERIDARIARLSRTVESAGEQAGTSASVPSILAVMALAVGLVALAVAAAGRRRRGAT